MDKSQIQEKLETIVSNGNGIGEAVLLLDKLLMDSGLCVDKRLAHYLEKRSYEKALKFLKGEKVEG